MNPVIPDAYKGETGRGVGTRMYHNIDNQRDISREMCQLYGRLRPTKRRTIGTQWSASRNTSIFIEYYVKEFEEMFILATKHPPEFMMVQMTEKAKTAVEICWVFQSHLNK